MDAPQLHETGLDARDLIGMREIVEHYPSHSPAYAALRSYATGRRVHHWLGPMPRPAAKIGRRKLWLKTEIESWLVLTRPKWQRTRSRPRPD